MDRRTSATLLALAALAASACGVRPSRAAEQAVASVTAALAPEAAREAVPPAAPAPKRVHARGDTVDAVLDVEASPAAARFALSVFNTADKRVELDFLDGRTRDFTVYDDAGRERWRWSRGRMFTQMMQNKPIAARDSARWTGEWDAPPPGRYTVVAELRSENYPRRRTATFVVPAAGAVDSGADSAAARTSLR